ncbi:MAG: hypothetical protein NC399_06940 [Muribaculum sp.]|nr:hypothetical protein [Muribaculum sp.]
MKIRMRKRLAATMAILIFGAAAVPGHTAYAVQTAASETAETEKTAKTAKTEKMEVIRDSAVRFLRTQQNPDGSYGEESIPKDTCEAVSLFRDLDVGTDSDTGLSDAVSWLQSHGSGFPDDNDSLARLYCATGDPLYFDCIPPANSDGGYGLTERYQSDPLDTALVLEAMVRHGLSGGEVREQMQGFTSYFGAEQNADGGFSYLPGGKSDGLLSLRIGNTLAAGEKYGAMDAEDAAEISLDEVFAGLDGYVGQADQNLENQKAFRQACYALVYRYLRGTLPDTEGLVERLAAQQNPDGSFGGNLDDTIAALRLLWAIEEADRPYVDIHSIEASLSTYTPYAGHETPVTVDTQLEYRCNYLCGLTCRIDVLKNGEVLTSRTTELVLQPEETQAACSATVKVTAQKEDRCQIRTRIIRDGGVVFEQTDDLHMTDLVIDELELKAERVSGGTSADASAGVSLTWNSLDNDLCRYGYRIYRSTDARKWESKSSWNGAETVKVLNIYPCEAAKNHLKNWMADDLQSEHTAAGKGLFEIDAVSIDAYNKAPNAYLCDENGEYRYDVLFFGAYDANAHKDLTPESYLATQEFVDTGRGVLFGHDTVTLADGAYHPYFGRFADQLGIKLRATSGYVIHNKVKVVDNGFLTSYPWKIEGTLSIPATHAYQQYAGGTLAATVWMEFPDSGYVDAETGGRTNAYLCTNNQLALIQTGNSNGQATDDERKVLANTLFYLKQLTGGTGAVDKSAYDTAAPGSCRISGLSLTEGLRFRVQAQDSGTTYHYYIEGIPRIADAEGLRRTSNVAQTEVKSGIAGYETAVNTDADAAEDEDWRFLPSAQSGTSSGNPGETDEEITIPKEWIPQSSAPLFLHIRAVDGQGNRGEETVVPLPAAEASDSSGAAYSLFAARDIQIYGGAWRTEGQVYAGGSLTICGSSARADAPCSAAGAIHAYVGAAALTECNEYAEPRQMPGLHASAMELVSGGRQEDFLGIYTAARLTEALYCSGTASIYCPEIRLEDNLVCQGDIRLGVDRAVLGSAGEIVVYSTAGNITINASHCTGRGIIYAPNGMVTVNAADFRFEGSIIARQITLQGTQLVITGQAQ